LDAILPHQPAILRRVCGHVGVANTPALRWLAEVRGEDGIDLETGAMLEDAILNLDDFLPSSFEETSADFDVASKLCLSCGITTAVDFLRGHDVRAYSAHLARGELPLDVYAYLVDPDQDWRSQLPSNRKSFRVRGIKLYADGSIGAGTAALFEDYAGRPDRRGQLLLDAETMARAVRAARESNLAVAIHAIGDRAIFEVLNAFERFPSEENHALGHRIEHLEMPRPGDLQRLTRIGARPCMQPNFAAVWGMPGGLYEIAVGAQRARAMNPLRTVLRSGCGLFFGSDGMPLSPLYGIRAAMNHPVVNERLSAEEAHQLYTRAAAEALSPHPSTGTLGEGWTADVTVLPRGFSWDEALPSTTVDLTIVKGRVAYSSEAFS
jgi:predicted amidohydrolase YtcJ